MVQAITLEALEVLDAIDRKGSFAAAAAALYRVPSAITYAVKKLEEDLRVTLFVKQGRRWVLTPAGKLLLTQGREMLMAAQQLTEAVRQTDSGWETALNITIDTVLGLEMIYPLLEEFFTLHADIEINLFSETLVGGFEALAEHRTDIAIGFLPPNDNHDIESYYYKTVRWAFVVGKNHPLLAKKTPLIKTDVEIYRSVVVRDSVKNSAAQSYRLFSKKPLLRVPSVQDKIKAQKAGLGVGYLPVLSIRDELASGELVALDISGVENNTELFVSWHKAEKGKALQWFVNKLRESAE